MSNEEPQRVGLYYIGRRVYYNAGEAAVAIMAYLGLMYKQTKSNIARHNLLL